MIAKESALIFKRALRSGGDYQLAPTQVQLEPLTIDPHAVVK